MKGLKVTKTVKKTNFKDTLRELGEKNLFAHKIKDKMFETNYIFQIIFLYYFRQIIFFM